MPANLLTRDLSHAFRLRRGGPLLWPAARSFLSMLVPLGALLWLDRFDLVAGAVFGALTSVYCRNEPHRRQARTLAAVGAGVVVSVALGDLLAVFGAGEFWHEPLALFATAVVGALATAACTAVRTGPPGGLIFAFATGACAHLPLTAADLPAHIGTTVFGAAFAWTLCYAGSVVRGLEPQRGAVAAALEATAAHVDADDLRSRHQAAVAVEAAWNSVAQVARRYRRVPAQRDLVGAVEVCEAVLVDAARTTKTAGRLRTAAASVRRRRPVALAGGAQERVAAPAPRFRWPVLRAVGTAVLRPGRHASRWLLPYTARIATAALAAGLLAHALGLGHAYWAAVSAVSVLQATSTSTSVPRMVQRVSGTVFGVLVGLAALSAEPAAWALVLLLALLQWGAEMTITINYAFGLFFATPVALLVSGLNSAQPPGDLALDRLWSTLLGAALAVVIARVAPGRAWLRRLHHALDHVRWLTGAEPFRPAPLRAALVDLHEAYDIAAGEIPAARLPTEDLLEVSRHAYRVLDTPGAAGAAAGPVPASPGPGRATGNRSSG